MADKAESSKLNVGGALAILALLPILIGVLLWISHANPSSFLPDLQINYIVIGVVFLAALILNAFISRVVYLYAKRHEWGFIFWTDSRLIPSLVEKKNRKPRPSNNPDLRVPIMNLPLMPRYGEFLIEQGEIIYGGRPFFGGQGPKSAWPTFWRCVRISLTLSTLTVIPFLIANYLLLLPLILLMGMVHAYTILHFWMLEWIRYSEFFVITSHKYILADVNLSIIGLIFKKGYDLNFRFTKISQGTDKDFGATPKKWGVSVSKPFEMYLEWWARSASQGGSVMIRNVARATSEFLLHYDFAQAIYNLLEGGQKAGAKTDDDIKLIKTTARKIQLGKPGEDSPDDIDVATWMKEWYQKSGYKDEGYFDIFAFRHNYLIQVSGRTPSNPPPIASTKHRVIARPRQ